MIINTATVILTLLAIGLLTAFGIKFIRSFALQIAKENHDAVMALDQKEETQRLKKERAADAAAATAFAKVQPILTNTTTAATESTTTREGTLAAVV
jgi:cell division protein FtsL